MKCLLDVSALVALGVVEHEFHRQVVAWVRASRSNGSLELLTCSITELGFVRVLAQTKPYGFTVATARALLLRMKTEDEALFTFVADNQGVSELPGWVKHPKQIRTVISRSSRRQMVQCWRPWTAGYPERF